MEPFLSLFETENIVIIEILTVTEQKNITLAFKKYYDADKKYNTIYFLSKIFDLFDDHLETNKDNLINILTNSFISQICKKENDMQLFMYYFIVLVDLGAKIKDDNSNIFKIPNEAFFYYVHATQINIRNDMIGNVMYSNINEKICDWVFVHWYASIIYPIDVDLLSYAIHVAFINKNKYFKQLLQIASDSSAYDFAVFNCLTYEINRERYDYIKIYILECEHRDELLLLCLMTTYFNNSIGKQDKNGLDTTKLEKLLKNNDNACKLFTHICNLHGHIYLTPFVDYLDAIKKITELKNMMYMTTINI